MEHLDHRDIGTGDMVGLMQASITRGDDDWEPGDLVRLREGPFADFPGVVLVIDPVGGSVTVAVDIFGRETQVVVHPGDLERPDS